MTAIRRSGQRSLSSTDLPKALRWEPIRKILAVGRDTKPLWWWPMWSLMFGLLMGFAISRFINIDAGPLSLLIYEGDPESARSFVSLVATAVATITSLSLTITVVTLQLASSQYSPRLIEHYLDDRGTRAVISLFLLTFAFAVATLLSVRLPGRAEDSVGEVPGPAISILIVLIVACLGALVVFVYRVTQSIRVEAILERVRDRTVRAIEARDEIDPTGDELADLPSPPTDGAVIRSRRSGFFVTIDRDLVDEFEAEDGLRVWILLSPGDFVTLGSPVAIVDGPAADDIDDVVESWLRFDSERWIESDYAYGVRSIADVAVKALSPGINDPTTAVMAVQRIAEVMAHAAGSHPDRSIELRGGGHVYVTVLPWAALLCDVLRQMALYGRDDVNVVVSVVRMLGSLAWSDSEIDRIDEIRAAAQLFEGLVGDERPPEEQQIVAAEFERLGHAYDEDATQEFMRHDDLHARLSARRRDGESRSATDR